MNESFNSSKKKLTANVKAGGCAAKLGAKELENILKDLPIVESENLIAGISGFEDACVYKISDDLAIVKTIDFFPALLDDPYLFGQIAACNALSDVYAMGAKPIIALNVLCFPTCDYPISVVKDILEGGASKVAESGACLAGGHSIQVSEPVYGLSVTGVVAPDKVLTNSGAQENDSLVLTKPIGTGVALLGMKGDELKESSKEILINNLTQLNSTASEIAQQFNVNAMTDITGFGLIGHVHEMTSSSKLNARMKLDKVEFFPQVIDLASQGFVPAGAYGNRQSYSDFVTYAENIELEYQDLLFDPQSSGGLLISIPESQAHQLVVKLQAENIQASVIGTLEKLDTSKKPGHIFVE